MTRSRHRQLIAIIAVSLVFVGVMPVPAAAQSDVGGTIVVEADETVSSIDAVAGSVIIEGTVNGDVSGVAGDVVIDGTVNGNVNVAAGSVRIGGTVDGDVAVAAGTVLFREGSTVSGTVEIGAGEVQLNGAIGGDARIGAEQITLGETATIDGGLTYDGTLEGNRDAVAGTITQDSSVSQPILPEFELFGSWVTTVYSFAANLLLGVILIGLFPGFSRGVVDHTRDQPLRAGIVGLGLLFAVPILLLLAAITIIGIPIALLGGLLFAVAVWIGVIYGRFLLGMIILSVVDSTNRWLALVIGLLAGVLLGLIPLVGGIANFLVFLLGFGGTGSLLYGRYKHTTGTTTEGT